MGRSPPPPPPLFPFHGTCGFHCLIPRHGDECIQRGIVSFNALEASRSKLDGRNSLAANQLGSFFKRQVRQVLRFSKRWLQSQTGGRHSSQRKKASAAETVWLHFYCSCYVAALGN